MRRVIFINVCGSHPSRRRTLLTGFAMRSAPKGFSEVSAPLTAERIQPYLAVLYSRMASYKCQIK